MDAQERSQTLDRRPAGGYRRRSLANLLRMGHCAPTVMQTLLDLFGREEEWPVKLSAGMPGGIGNTGFECGAVTSPLAMLGLRYGLRESDAAPGLPVIFDKGQALCRHFRECHKTMLCREIRDNDRFPRHCIRPVVLSPELFQDTVTGNGGPAIPEDIRQGYTRLYAHLAENDFHCAQAVLDRLPLTAANRQEILDATSAFLGGTLFLGLTCSAFAAGVMAIGLESGEIENSRLRVIRLLAVMTTGGNAFDESLNKFNRSMNAGYWLSKWFAREFGGTQCRAITGCDFSTPEGVRRYVESDSLARCREIAEQVAARVQQVLAGEN